MLRLRGCIVSQLLSPPSPSPPISNAPTPPLHHDPQLLCAGVGRTLAPVVVGLTGRVVAANSKKGKEPLEDNLQDPEPEEEVESEAEEEVEEDSQPNPRATIASIGVVESPVKFKRTERMSTGGSVPRHALASRTPPAGRKEDSQSEGVWENNSKSWNSQNDIFMNRIEQNTKMIQNLTYMMDGLKELIVKLIKDSPSTPKN